MGNHGGAIYVSYPNQYTDSYQYTNVDTDPYEHPDPHVYSDAYEYPDPHVNNVLVGRV